MDAEMFCAYVKEVFAPELNEGDIVVMDNLSAHKSPTIARLLENAGAQLRYLPPYSPDFNPIEMMWSKIKAYLRTAAARTEEAVHTLVQERS